MRVTLSYPQMVSLYRRGLSVAEMTTALQRSGVHISKRKVYKHLTVALWRGQ